MWKSGGIDVEKAEKGRWRSRNERKKRAVERKMKRWIREGEAIEGRKRWRRKNNVFSAVCMS